jgi:predicted acylesterase/phospholipase RssA
MDLSVHNAASHPRPLRVLSLDGGGIRGYYAARVIEHLLEQAGRRPSEYDCGSAFDLVVGTSTGAILGSALASGLPITNVSALYRAWGTAIFRSPSPTGWTALLWGLRNWSRPSADSRALRAALSAFLGEETLAELHQRRGIAMCVTATNSASSVARVIATPHREAYRADGHVMVVAACMASSAAPILLPPVRIGPAGAEVWCDGGIWANNPIGVGLAEALAMSPERPIEIVSVGTCVVPLGSAVARTRTKGLGFWTRGVRALQLAADAQAQASVDLVQSLVPHLRRAVRILRVSDATLGEVEASVLRLDNPSNTAFDAMDGLAERTVLTDAGASANREIIDFFAESVDA